MTKDEKLKAALQVLGVEAAKDAKAAYRREALSCHPDKLVYPLDANDDQKQAILKSAQERFVAISTAYQMLSNPEEVFDDEEDIQVEPSAHNPFWNKPLRFEDDIAAELNQVFSALFSKSWTEGIPHSFCIGYMVGANLSAIKNLQTFSSQAGLAAFCNAYFNNVNGALTFTVLNFPRLWLGTIYDKLAANPDNNITAITFPKDYQLEPAELRKWQALVKNPQQQQTVELMDGLQRVVAQNKAPIIGGAAIFVLAAVLSGSIFFPLLLSVGSGVALREAQKRLKENDKNYEPEKIATLPPAEVEAYHLGEEATKGLTPFANALLDPKMRQAPVAFVTGVHHALTEEPKQRLRT